MSELFPGFKRRRIRTSGAAINLVYMNICRFSGQFLAEQLQLDRNHRQALVQVVMQVLRQSFSLILLRKNEPAANLSRQEFCLVAVRLDAFHQ